MSSSKKFTSSSQSPLSSGGSLGTPETNITSFSPDEPRKHSLSLTTPLKAGHQDPFISTGTKLKVEQKLSATATAFQPYTLYGAMGIPMVANGSGSGSGLKPGTTQYLENVVATSNLAAAGANHSSSSTQYDTFSTDIGISRCMEVRIPNGDAKLFLEELLKELEQNGQPLGKPNHIGGVGNVASLRFTNISDAMAAYSTMKMNHSLCAVTYIEPEELNRRVTPNSKAAISRHEGQVILTAKYPIGYSPRKKDFEDSLRAALAAEGKLFACAKLPATEIGTLRMVAEFCDCTHAVRAIKRLDGTSIKNVIVSIDHWSPDLVSQLPNHRLVTANTPTRSSGEQPTVEESLGRMSLGNGRIPALTSVGTPGIANMAYAGHPHTQLSMSSTGLVMGGMYPSPSILGFPASYAGLTTPPRQYTAQNDFVPTFTPVGFGHQGYSYHQNQYQALTSYQGSPSSFRFFGSPSPTGGRDIVHGGRSSGRRQNAVKIPHNSRNRQHPNALSHHNHVDIHRIRQGIDVRTTVMLRNIPNKVDQSMLKSIVDESSHGKYDFMYLRIDFSNDCNVGYAFINFTDPLDIINFVIARSNQKWHRFKSDKVAEISYATIQGKDCLVQKFRNSSVMLEPPHYRPKLFFTANDPFGRAGEEEEFPTSDNASKLKRSCENAEHVGLFAPSAGQHLRDEQRRRRSQFDRGTSFAENEEFDLEDEIDGELEYAPFYPYPSY